KAIILESALRARPRKPSRHRSAVCCRVGATEQYKTPDCVLTKEYGDALTGLFDSSIADVDFGSPEFADNWSNWASDETWGIIPVGTMRSILDLHLQDDNEQFVYPDIWYSNLLYFAAGWEEEYDPELSDDRIFTQADGTETIVRMMRGEQEVYYVWDDRGEFVRLPFANDNINLNLFLPDIEDNASLSDFNCLRRNSYMAQSVVGETELVIPILSVSSDVNLDPVFENMGLNGILKENNPDFTGFAGNGESRQSFFQNLSFKLDEKGAEAMVITSSESLVTKPAPGELPDRIEFNRPFLFSVEAYGVVLLAGRVSNFD
ncbi:MAG: hypothetical protein NC336_02135, partial [Clostridium sp.]|nr:hypothetical protein [Clostridium sp.]